MSVNYNSPPPAFLNTDELDAWIKVPVSIIGDELNRTQIMQSAIKALSANRCFAGLACTVSSMVGDNLAAHHALSAIRERDVLVIDARAHEDTAVWGEVMQTAALQRKISAVIVDGAVRDAAALRESPLPVYARAVCPAGPHKGFGGQINGPIQCAGVCVNPGDLIIGDDDGVVVVRPQQVPGLLERCHTRLANEEKMFAAIRAGVTTVELMGLEPVIPRSRGEK